MSSDARGNGRQRKMRRIRRLDPYVPFPVEALPGPIAAFVTEASLSIGCDPAFLALPALAVTAAAIGAARRVELRSEFKVPCILWTAVVAPTGSQKTPAFRAALRPMKVLQQRYDRERAEMPRVEGEAEPDGQRILCEDITVERLVKLLSLNPRGLLVAHDELSGWFESFQRYKVKGSDVPRWLKLYDGEDITVDRATAERSVRAHDACASLCGSIQPAIYARSMTADMIASGLSGRLLLAMPPEKDQLWKTPPLRAAIVKSYCDCIRHLRELPCKERRLGAIKPSIIRPTPEADEIYGPWFEANDRAKRQELSEAVRATRAKAAGTCARLALVHHVVTRCDEIDGNDRVPIEPASIEAAIKLTEWFLRETDRVYANCAETEEHRSLRGLVEEIQRREGKITTRDLQRHNQKRYATSRDAKDDLDKLVDMGLAQWIDSDEREVALVDQVDDDAEPAAIGGDAGGQRPQDASPAELAAAWYRKWDAGTLAQPLPRDIETAAELVAVHGERSIDVVNCLVEVVRKRWPTCNTFVGAVKVHLPDAVKMHVARRRRDELHEQSRAKQQEDAVRTAAEQETNRHRRALWDALDDGEKQEIECSIRDQFRGKPTPEAFILGRCLEAMDSRNGHAKVTP